MPADLPLTATTRALRRYEQQLSRLLMAFLATGLVYLLGPGSLLGLRNLWAISHQHSATAVSAAWLQAHGHAEVYGWVGSFILGIGLHSLTRIANVGAGPCPPAAGVPLVLAPAWGPLSPKPALRRAAARVHLGWAWCCWLLWTSGVGLRWWAGVAPWHWRLLLPGSALLELGAFAIFQASIRRAHRGGAAPSAAKLPGWMLLVFTGAAGFLLTLLLNLAAAAALALHGASPVLPPTWDEPLVGLMGWAFLVPFVFGFSTRWLPVFAGLRPARAALPRQLALLLILGAAATLAGWDRVAAAAWLVAAVGAGSGLHLFQPAVQPAKTQGIHPSFRWFVRAAYFWLVVAAGLAVAAASSGHAAGLAGAARHALTVGFIAGMVLTIGPRVLPAFAGMRLLYSPRLMLVALALLHVGCLLRVAGEALAYSGWWNPAWSWLPWSAGLEVTAFTVFAYNLARTLLRPPAHRMRAGAQPAIG